MGDFIINKWWIDRIVGIIFVIYNWCFVGLYGCYNVECNYIFFSIF